jgi:hypothetical protein
VRLLSGRHDSRTFEVVEISPNQAYLKHLLHEFDADIQHKARPWSATSPEPQDTALADCSRADIPLYRLCRSPNPGYRDTPGRPHRQSRGPGAGQRARRAVAMGTQQDLPSHQAHGRSWPGGACGVLRGRPRGFRRDRSLRAVLRSRRAAPGHVMAVRRLMFDAFSEAEKAALAAVIDKLLARTDHAPTQ